MSCCGSSNEQTEQTNSNLNSIDQLKIRLAKGEISIDEYVKTKAVLAES
jgi:uncharacterized membrane protein